LKEIGLSEHAESFQNFKITGNIPPSVEDLWIINFRSLSFKVHFCLKKLVNGEKMKSDPS
jgi:hypothetical protein